MSSPSLRIPWARRRTLLAAGYLTGIVLLTLAPAGTRAEVGVRDPLCLLCGARGTADAVLNLLFFLPLGFLLARPLGPWKAVLAAASLSLGVEVLQLRVPGRFPTAGDFVFNTVGAGAGAALAFTWRRWVFPSPGERRRRFVGWTMLVGVVLLGTAWAFGPSVPERPIYGQWTADFGDMATYEGRVLEARIGEVEAPSRRLERSERARAALLRGEPVRVRFVAGPPPPGPAPIFSVYDDRQTRVFLLAADGHDLVLAMRRRADDLRLDRPELRVREALRSVEAGDTVALSVERPTAATWRIWKEVAPGGGTGSVPAAPGAGPDGAAADAGDVGGSEVERFVEGYSLARGWSLLLFAGGWPPWLGRAFDLLWLVALVVPLGWWAPGVLWAFGGGALYLGGLALVPAAFGMAPTSPGAFVAAFGGLFLAGATRHICATDWCTGGDDRR